MTLDPVVIAGVGMTPFGRFPDTPPASLVHAAVRAALADANVTPGDVDSVMFGTVFGGPGLGQRSLKDLGFAGLPIVNIENACATSSTAVHEGVTWIRAKHAEVVLCVGVESLSRQAPAHLDDEDPLTAIGMMWPAAYGLKARAHMERYGTTREQLALVAVKNRRHAMDNPLAQFRSEVSLQDVMESRPICDPLTLLQCCPPSDGASAVVLMSEERARDAELGLPRIRLAGSALRSGALADQTESVRNVSTVTAELAYEQSGISPEDVDIAEVHDAFTIGEILNYEALGFCPEGEGGKYVEDGRATIGGGGVAVNTSGGLLSRGHAVGASGIAQLVELTNQLRGTAAERQVEGARVALAHIMGGTIYELQGNACAIHVLVV